METNNDDKRITEVNENSNGSGEVSITKKAGGAPVLFNARRYVGTGTDGREVSGFGFQPDAIWIKVRNQDGVHHNLYDSVRGVNATDGNKLIPNHNTTQNNSGFGYGNIQNITKDGFTLEEGTENSHAHTNATNDTYVAWAWKAGGEPSAGKQRIDNSSSETTLSSSTHYSNITNMKQSVNSTGKFSITQYTGGSNTSWFKHGLGATTPDMFIIKNLSSTDNWIVWHKDLSSGTNKWLYLNEDDDEQTGSVMWANTAPDSDGKIHLGNTSQVNTNNSYICYAWKSVSGVSAFGSYTGSSSGVTSTNNIGFQPRFVIIKRASDAAQSWVMLDTFRQAVTTDLDNYLLAESTGPENGNNNWSNGGINLVTNGFEIPSSSTSGAINSLAGHTYIYMAFA